MDKQAFNEGLLNFIANSPTPFHATKSMTVMLADAGYTPLDETESWALEAGGRYYVIRNGSALIAFSLGKPTLDSLPESGIRIAGAHTDSPCLKIKPTPEVMANGYLQLGVEVYGGALLNPWFDRDLSMAGRVHYLTAGGELDSCLIDVKDPIACIPSLAIHLDKTANENRTVNAQQHLAPVIFRPSGDTPFVFKDWLLERVRDRMGITGAQSILSFELSLYDTQAPAMLGIDRQFIASARLDNLLSCYLACHSLVESRGGFNMIVCNDHEEVGSVSTAGAQGPFLKSVLRRIVAQAAQADTQADTFDRVVRRSLLYSIDNAHGVHPNYADRHDANHGPLLNAGPVIKINANQRYASNDRTTAGFKALCGETGIAFQEFVMRSDMACGSTIGPITAGTLGIDTVDIGVPTFAMHSIRELAGSEDAANLASVVTAWFNR
ncbi:MAG: M18 family aminopeptidase [Pseudohongiellaceae bacterium]